MATSIKDKGEGRLLDVGSGYGIFLSLVKDLGWVVYGIELSENACQFARINFGLIVFCGDLKEASFPKDHFDVVILWNVLDHTTNPLEQHIFPFYFDSFFKLFYFVRKGSLFLSRPFQ